MSYNGESAIIFGRLETSWATTTPIAWPNVKYEPTGAAYIEPRIIRNEAFNVTVPAARVRHPGLLTVTVRTPLNQGYGLAEQYGDTIAGYFRNTTVNGVVFRAPTVTQVGADENYYVVQVDCPFWRDEIFN